MVPRIARYVCTNCEEVRWIHAYQPGKVTCGYCGATEFRRQDRGGNVRMATPLANVQLLAKPRDRRTFRCTLCGYAKTVVADQAPGLVVEGKAGFWCPDCFDRAVPGLLEITEW